MKFHENPSSGSRAATCGELDKQTDMTKLKGAFRDCANAAQKLHLRKEFFKEYKKTKIKI
jgi:hypothetical protein